MIYSILLSEVQYKPIERLPVQRQEIEQSMNYVHS